MHDSVNLQSCATITINPVFKTFPSPWKDPVYPFAVTLHLTPSLKQPLIDWL